MSLKLFSLVGALVMGVTVTAASASQGANEDLASLMKREGTPKPIRIETRADLAGLMSEAAAQAAGLGEGCELRGLSEVHVTRQRFEFIAGYEAYVHCDDEPTPAVALYFDVNEKFLAALSLAN